MEGQCDCPERPRTAGVKPAWNKPAWEVGDSFINLNVNKKVEGLGRGKKIEIRKIIDGSNPREDNFLSSHEISLTCS